MSPAAAPAPNADDLPETVYVRNEDGAVHSVTREHYLEYLVTRTNAGRTFPLPGWSIVTETEAKKSNPQLFGKPDPTIVFTDEELIRHHSRQKLLAELRGVDVLPEVPNAK
jgi:hypothetical protein